MKKLKCAHLCVYDRNAGDNALNLAIEDKLHHLYEFDYIPLLRNQFNSDMIKKLQTYDTILLGGGGLIHSYRPDLGKWDRTGTMWNIRLQDLKKLTAKIILYGVGFNRFDGEPPPLKQMGTFFQILKDKGALVSFRNDGSRENFNHYFPQFKNDFMTIPDPGLLYRCTDDVTKEHVVINIASDRIKIRYNKNQHKSFDDFMVFLKKIRSMFDCPVILVPHTPDDYNLYKSIKIDNCTIFPFYNKKEDTHKIFEVYKKSYFTISTRGHSQLCSIGNSIPTFSISTHPKVKDFMKNYQMTDYCYNYHISSHDLGIRKFKSFLLNYNKRQLKEHIKELNQQFDADTEEFIRRITQYEMSHMRKPVQ